MDGSWYTSQDPDEFFNKNMLIDLIDELFLNKEDNMFDWEILDNYAAQILNAKYEQVDTNKVGADQKQLNNNQCHNLQHLLAENKKLFDGYLGVYPHQRSTLIYYQAHNRSPPRVSHPLSSQTIIQKGTPTHGWYWNYWRMQSLSVGLVLSCLIVAK